MGKLPEVRETRIGAYGVIIRNDHMLLIKKAKGAYKGLLDLPGGGIEFAESPEEAMIREFMEEAGLAVTVGAIVGTFTKVTRFLGDHGDRYVELHHLGFLFRATAVDPGAPIKTDADGLDSLGAVWMPVVSLTPQTASPLVMRALTLLGAAGEQ